MSTPSPEDTPHRAGTIAVLGRPNVGKSTLVNALVGAKVSIVSPKPQTTRHRLLGIATFQDGQIALVDTPGLHRDPDGRAMNRYMNRAARRAVDDVDGAALVVEAGRWTDEDSLAYKVLGDAGVPVVLVINKVDKLVEKGALLPFIAEVTKDRQFAAVHPVSARKQDGLRPLIKSLLALLPESPPLFAEDEITDRSERFLAAELVREQLMRKLGQEVPYSTTVEIEKFEEEGDKLRIAAIVWVEREGQKAIVIGQGGEMLKLIGSAARIAMEKLFGRRVFLQTWVRVREGWSDDEAALRQFGYGE
ncbi:GTPase Era [Silanimonas sp.]|uniref:GTPase Era n=1 Tax=Silanimonas sp. TaxID=1929290 RepID=UPI001BC78CA3|nr:GTPase Era [Silanimonas sp.]MBS3895621.1 GTPase Era [Silanimonas sp.]MBS3924296.1 GTPase Era [Xanthomonadaceae bacterium]